MPRRISKFIKKYCLKFTLTFDTNQVKVVQNGEYQCFYKFILSKIKISVTISTLEWASNFSGTKIGISTPIIVRNRVKG